MKEMNFMKHIFQNMKNKYHYLVNKNDIIDRGNL